MQKLGPIFILSFTTWVTLSADPLQDAKTYFDATLYETAIEKYRPLFKNSSLTEEERHEVQVRLAQSYLYQQNPQAALEVLNEIPTTAAGNYLKGIAYKSLQQPYQALLHLEFAAQAAHPWQAEANLELGGLRFELQLDPDLIRSPLEEVKSTSGKEELYHNAQLYLARLDLRCEQWDKAIKRLRALQMSLPSGSLSNIQAAFWMGVAHHQKGNLHDAIQAFAAALPKKGSSATPWHTETLRLMVDCTLKLAQMQGSPSFYNQAEELLKGSDPSEERDLALAEIYLLRGKQFADEAFTKKGREILQEPNRFNSLTSRAKLCAILAQVTEKDERDKYLTELTSERYRELPLYREGWLYRGKDWLQRGLLLQKNDPAAAKEYFLKAAHAFAQSGTAAIYLRAEALWRHKGEESLRQALQLLKGLKKDATNLYLQGLVAAELDSGQAILLLESSLGELPEGSDTERLQLLLGTLYFKNRQIPEALKYFLLLGETSYDEEIGSRALLYAATCVEDKPEEARALRQKVYESYPTTSAAAEGYFLLYPYRDYIQGDRAALKHLQSFHEKFPRSPLGIVALYLTGMDFKRDRKTVEGKWIRKKDLNRSIEAFQEGETLFDELKNQQMIPETELPFYNAVKIRSTLERALANLAIADDAQGAKRQIFLEYAEEVFREIGKQIPSSETGYPPLLEESHYWLTQTLLKQGRKKEAKEELEKMIARYREASLSRGYFISRVWYELGQLALEEQKPLHALEFFAFAEEAGKGKILSTDQRIDLLIQQSLCQLALNEPDKAMLILSQAINSDEISNLRIKAMYLRAEVYLQQGRKELARKQLEATSKKGGEWAKKAKQKLDEEL